MGERARGEFRCWVPGIWGPGVTVRPVVVFVPAVLAAAGAARGHRGLTLLPDTLDSAWVFWISQKP